MLKERWEIHADFRRTFKGLLHYWFSMKGEDMQIELTPEKVAELVIYWVNLKW